jgi:hypothetical protein
MPGKVRVFLSFHRANIADAGETRRALESAGVDVISYDPECLWGDGPMEMLGLIVTQCHCIVYVGPRSLRSRFVRFEHAIAKEFDVPRLRVAFARRAPALIPKLRELGARQSRTLWPGPASHAISRALQALEVHDFAQSRIVDAGRTAPDIGLDRTTAHHLNKLGNAIREGQRLLLIASWVVVFLIVATVSILFKWCR